MLSTAKLRYLRITPRKVRLVVNLIRGEKLEKAQIILNFTQKKAALPVLKLLNQALANAVEKDLKLDKKNVYISEIFVDGGPSYKRTFPRARGRADVILKRTSHITIVLDEIDKKVKKPSKDKVPEAKRKKIRQAEEKKIIEPEKEEKKEISQLPEKEQEEKKEEESASVRAEWRKKRSKTEKIRSKREGGLRRFFRRKAI